MSTKSNELNVKNAIRRVNKTLTGLGKNTDLPGLPEARQAAVDATVAVASAQQVLMEALEAYEKAQKAAAEADAVLVALVSKALNKDVLVKPKNVEEPKRAKEAPKPALPRTPEWVREAEEMMGF